MNMTLSQIADAMGGSLSATANCQKIITGFFTDSRVPCDDKLFLAIKGEHFDGNSFVQGLTSMGYGAVTDDASNLSCKGDVIYVSNVTEALQRLAESYRINSLNSLNVVGITGSVGKTTTKDMVAAALSGGLNVYKTQGNFNSQIGLPQTVLGASAEYGCAVLELGMSFKGEMERIARCARPNLSIITNVGYSHLENLGTREAIRDEKLKIASFSPQGSALLLNGDEPLLRNINYSHCKIYYVSVKDNTCDCYATDVVNTENGISFTAHVFGKSCKLNLTVFGSHYVLNALFSLAAAHLLGVNVNDAANSLSNYQSDGRRQYIYSANGHKIISDCYNASPESMEAALSVLKNSTGRRVAVLGDMLELGKFSVDLHQRVGDYTTNSVDVLITFGDMARYISLSSKVNEKYHFGFEKREELSAFLKGFIKENDTVLYKASNGIKLFELIV